MVKDAGYLVRFRSTRFILVWHFCFKDNSLFQKKIFHLLNYNFPIYVIKRFNSDIREIF